MRVVSILAALIVATSVLAACGGGGPSDLTLASTPTTVRCRRRPRPVARRSPRRSRRTRRCRRTRPLVAHATRAPSSRCTTTPDVGPTAARARRIRGSLPRTIRPRRPRRCSSSRAQQPDGWVKVLLPVAPNGQSGWVRGSDVTVSKVATGSASCCARVDITVFDRGQGLLPRVGSRSGAPRTPDAAGPLLRAHVAQGTDACTRPTARTRSALRAARRTITTFTRQPTTRSAIHGNDEPVGSRAAP